MSKLGQGSTLAGTVLHKSRLDRMWSFWSSNFFDGGHLPAVHPQRRGESSVFFFRCETKVARHHIETMRNSEFSENQDFGCVVAKGTLKNHRRYMEISCYLRNVCWCAVAAWERVQGSKASVGHAWIGSQEHSIRRSMEQHSAGAATTLVCQVSDSKKRFRWSLEMSTLKNWNLMWVLTLPFSHFSSSLPMVICCEKPLRSRFWCRWDPSDIADIPPGSSSRGIARKSPPAMPCQLKLCCQVGSKKIQDQTWFSTLILFSTLFDCEDEKWYAKNWKMENGDHKRWPSLHHWPRNAMKPRGGEVHLSVTNLILHIFADHLDFYSHLIKFRDISSSSAPLQVRQNAPWEAVAAVVPAAGDQEVPTHHATSNNKHTGNTEKSNRIQIGPAAP